MIPVDPRTNRGDRTLTESRYRRSAPAYRLLFASVALLASCLLLSGSVAAAEVVLEGMDGAGTADDPYVITTVDELQAMDADLEAHYVLGDDIDASETREWNGYAGFEPIGSGSAFTGSLDGKHYEIRGLVIDRPATEGVGLVSTTNGTIENVRLVDATVVGERYVGGLVGIAHEDAVLSRNSISGSVTGDHQTGGLVGQSAGEVTDSTSTATLEDAGDQRRSLIGGLVGVLKAGSVERSMAAGDVTGIRVVGGLVGTIDDGAHVSDSYAAGDVNGVDHEDTGSNFGWEDSSFVGGLVGASDGSVATSFSTGAVTGTERYHGSAGSHNRVIDAYWDVDASGHDRGSEDDPGGLTGLTTAEMTGSGVVHTMSALDFETAFESTENGYPILRAELAPAEFRVIELEGPDELEVDTAGTITATIENAGQLEETGRVSLTLDGATESSMALTLGPDERGTVAFEFSPDIGGKHEYVVETDADATPTDTASTTVVVTESEAKPSSSSRVHLVIGAAGAFLAASLVAAVGRR